MSRTVQENAVSIQDIPSQQDVRFIPDAQSPDDERSKLPDVQFHKEYRHKRGVSANTHDGQLIQLREPQGFNNIPWKN